jgi:C-terminal processing protease CtpA/Prc
LFNNYFTINEFCHTKTTQASKTGGTIGCEENIRNPRRRQTFLNQLAYKVYFPHFRLKRNFMKNIFKPLIQRLGAVIFLSISAFNFVAAQTTKESSPQIRQKTFEKVWQTVNEKYFDANFGGVDWRQVHERYAPQAAKVKTNAELHQLLNKMLGELKVSHMGILTPETLEKLKQPPTVTGLSLREIENQIVVTRLIEDSSALQAGIRRGFVVKKIDGEPIKTLEDALLKLSGAPNTTLRLSYLNEKDELREAILERRTLANTDNRKSNCRYTLNRRFVGVTGGNKTRIRRQKN